jgi:hypothetical protein
LIVILAPRIGAGAIKAKQILQTFPYPAKNGSMPRENRNDQPSP